MNKKYLQIKAVDDEAGVVDAVFATLDVIDHDKDVTIKGAFGTQEAPIVPSHTWDSIPLGKAQISESGNEAVASMKFNLDIVPGREWFSALKFDFQEGRNPLQQYSYAYDILEAEGGEKDGEKVQFLKALKVHEVSPVLLGAGINTRTLAYKGGVGPKGVSLMEEFETLAKSLADLEGFCSRIKSLADLRGKEGRTLSKVNADRLRQLAETVSGVSAGLDQLIEDTTPRDNVDEVAALFARYQQCKLEMSHLLR